MTTVRERVRVQGTVQGVGFRPFVYRVATELALGGWVLNDERGVLLEVEGPGAAVDAFRARLAADPPPLAVIDSVDAQPRPPAGERAFRIRHSTRADPHAAPPVAPDTAPCADCLAELRDPADRRFRYPFINCTNCGPRLTIVTGVPYDRPLTTMAGFSMCPACAAEYADPADRRFHAQPNACPVCGPRLALATAEGVPVDDLGGARDAIEWVGRRLAAGAIVAVKSVGGFHLVCDGASEPATAALRARKHREDKPFALLAGSLAAAHRLVELHDSDAALLVSPAAPIVLAPRRAPAAVAAAVAPGLPELGVMLPSAPLHHLLVADFAAACGDPGRPLVMTSANLSDEPIAFRDDDALARLGGIADVFLGHNRPIETRVDDSVTRTVKLPGGRTPTIVRRSRGFVPASLTLPVAARRPLLACGAEQKSTFCLAGGDRAWVGHHIGDLEHAATLTAFTTGIDHFTRLFALAPQLVVRDLHPGYLSTQYALEREAEAHLAVQHHHAHLAACLAEHGVAEPAVGAIFDGTGYGTDGTVWGGELLVGDLATCQRVGWLWPVAMPGGAAAVRQPWRMASAWLGAAFDEPASLPRLLRGRVEPARWRAIPSVTASPAVSPLTSSVGRLLDAVAALCGLHPETTYEGQAAIALEAAAWTADGAPPRDYEVELGDGPSLAEDPDRAVILDPRLMIRAVADDLEAGAEVPAVAAGVHAALTAATAAAVIATARRHRLATAILSGGVFQNRWLLQGVAAALHAAGLRVLVPQRLPVNDGGISFGQAAIAAARDHTAHASTIDATHRR